MRSSVVGSNIQLHYIELLAARELIKTLSEQITHYFVVGIVLNQYACSGEVYSRFTLGLL